MARTHTGARNRKELVLVTVLVPLLKRCGALPKSRFPQPTAGGENGPHRSENRQGIGAGDGAGAVAGAVRCVAEIKVSASNGWTTECPKRTQERKIARN